MTDSDPSNPSPIPQMGQAEMTALATRLRAAPTACSCGTSPNKPETSAHRPC
jgi:hypothetical protein